MATKNYKTLFFKEKDTKKATNFRLFEVFFQNFSIRKKYFFEILLEKNYLLSYHKNEK